MDSKYFDHVNRDLLAWIPQDASCILEVGCGSGSLGREAMRRNPAVRYVAVEHVPEVAQRAAGILSHVLAGDIEDACVLQSLDDLRCDFDTLVLGDVLEHLRDPGRVLQALAARTTEGGVCVVCVPNVAHWSVVQQLMRGRWDYTDAGLLDRTHLRFFTRETLLEMFRSAGWTVVDIKPRIAWPQKTQAAVQQLLPLAPALGRDPQAMQRDLSTYQWVVRAVKGPAPEPLRIAALALRKAAGVNEARIDYPLTALATRPGVETVWGAGQLSLPVRWPSGVMILHRNFLGDPAFVGRLQAMAARGWILVSEIDDDPRRWPEFAANDFRAFRAVHAVSVSTEPLAQLIRQWNPQVQVFQNAIFELPQVAPGTPKQAGPLRIFFGALNREADWGAVYEGVAAAASQLGQAVQWVVVHDQAFFDALPPGSDKVFHPTLAHARYMEVLASCDLALLPLQDTPFNRLKSDLKLIECAAAGVVPVCSPVVYAGQPAHAQIALFAQTPQEWRDAIVSACQDPPALASRRARALAYVRDARMHSHQLPAREAWYRGLLADHASLEAQRLSRMGPYEPGCGPSQPGPRPEA